MAERLMRAVVPVDVPVTSAGTRARAGEPIWPAAAIELERRGVSALGFDAHPITAALVKGADLVLTATRAHRDEVLSAYPSALGRVFTWRELGWLVGALSVEQLPGRTAAERLHAMPAAAAARRGVLVPPPPAELDISDPVGGPDGAVAVAAVEIEQALGPVLRLLAS
jgi:protein-tyrosine phosphatase